MIVEEIQLLLKEIRKAEGVKVVDNLESFLKGNSSNSEIIVVDIPDKYYFSLDLNDNSNGWGCSNYMMELRKECGGDVSGEVRYFPEADILDVLKNSIIHLKDFREPLIFPPCLVEKDREDIKEILKKIKSKGVEVIHCTLDNIKEVDTVKYRKMKPLWIDCQVGGVNTSLGLDVSKVEGGYKLYIHWEEEECNYLGNIKYWGREMFKESLDDLGDVYGIIHVEIENLV